MTSDPRDLIRDILDKVKQRNADFTEEMALTIEAEVRSEWAGERVYIAHRAGATKRGMAAMGSSAKDLQKRFGISRSWAFRLTQTTRNGHE
jgi:molybdopterin synthase catalytic subunit